MDVEGQYTRTHKRAKICPISGRGSLTQSERKRRASEIIAGSGADTEEHFNRVVKAEACTTFEEHAESWLKQLRERKRKPLAHSTLSLWESCLTNWINPDIGLLPLSHVNNAALKQVVAVMSKGGLSPKSIDNYAQVVKMVVASAMNEEGEQLFPRKWNHDFMDMPIVEEAKQNTPSFSAVIMTGLAKWQYPRERMLFILCGAAGLRIGEALGLEIGKHITEDFRTLNIVQQVHHGVVEERVKTASATRQVDLHPSVAALLQKFAGVRKSGFLFCTRNGKPVGSSNILRRHLHPALKTLSYLNPYTGDHKAGNHAFRRFRNTYLRNYTDCPEGLQKFWLGHAGESMTDLYDKVKEDVEFRRMWAEKCGIGFELPELGLSVVPNVPKVPKKAAMKKATEAA
ncbi:MAG: tyrosine-type recombinase/integrase [Terracidiphilus sp.]|nr:tyrosine-type recombinase/integrase [Terracidiphilus sp.]